MERVDETNELSTAELEEVTGGIFTAVGVMVAQAYGAYKYHQWLKANDKI